MNSQHGPLSWVLPFAIMPHGVQNGRDRCRELLLQPLDERPQFAQGRRYMVGAFVLAIRASYRTDRQIGRVGLPQTSRRASPASPGS